MSIAINCKKDRNVELLRDIVDSCEETDNFEAISVNIIVLVKKQFRRTKIYKTSDIVILKECFYLFTRLALPIYLDCNITTRKF